MGVRWRNPPGAGRRASDIAAVVGDRGISEGKLPPTGSQARVGARPLRKGAP
jgi:hypothetical protein